jgi:prostaglandin-endoperoxide synthase 2
VIEEYINHIDPACFHFFVDPTAFPNERWYRQNWMCAEFNLLYRWHGLIPSSLVLDGQEVPIEQTMFNTSYITSRGVGAVMQDSSRQRAGRIGLFNTTAALHEAEVASVQMCRDLQLASYNDYREVCSYPRATAFDQISGDPRVQEGLKRVYADVDRVDYCVGIFAEDTMPNGILPPLIGRLVAIDAFSQALTNPLLAPSVYNELTFSPLGMECIATTNSLGELVKRNVPAGSPAYYISMTREGWRRT